MCAAKVTPLYPLFVVKMKGPQSSGYVVLRAKNDEHAKELAKGDQLLPFQCEVDSVTQLHDPGGPEVLYAFFESGPRKNYMD